MHYIFKLQWNEIGHPNKQTTQPKDKDILIHAQNSHTTMTRRFLELRGSKLNYTAQLSFCNVDDDGFECERKQTAVAIDLFAKLPP